jgi:phage terminase large subunit-like protein
MPEPIPMLPSGDNLAEAGRDALIDYYEHCKSMAGEWVYRQVVENCRVDILASILNYEVQPFHLALMRFQMIHPQNLQLCFRGAGKTTVCTVTRAIFMLIRNRNIRILIASKTKGNAESMLKEIKGHLEENRRLTEIFGAFYDPNQVTKWDNTEIEILGRTKKSKESSITVVGVAGALASKHVDVILADDLVDEENARTKYMRDRVKQWYYQILDPVLEPPEEGFLHRGEFHHLGTRYHFDDLYGHLMANELKEHHQVIPALDEHERSPWPEKFSPEFLKAKKEKAGTIIFNAQYQCDTEAMKGEVFQYDDCQRINEEDVPSGLKLYMGVDLAISEDEKNDLFAIVVGGFDQVENCYVLDYFEGHLRFSAQTAAIKRYYKKHDPIRAAIETNSYQAAQYQTLKDDDQTLRLVPVHTEKDKTSRAWKLSSRFEDKKMFFVKGGNIHKLIEAIVLFPSFRYKDPFDALDLMVRASKVRRRRKRRRREPGII